MPWLQKRIALARPPLLNLHAPEHIEVAAHKQRLMLDIRGTTLGATTTVLPSGVYSTRPLHSVFIAVLGMMCVVVEPCWSH